MKTTHPVHVVAALAILVAAGACTEPFSSPPNDPSMAGLTVIPRSATIRSGQVVALKATLVDESGNAVQTATVSWTSSNESVATVGATGEVLGRGEGRANITAAAQGRAESSVIRVLHEESKPEKNPALQ
jgi:hypothetical protein